MLGTGEWLEILLAALISLRVFAFKFTLDRYEARRFIFYFHLSGKLASGLLTLNILLFHGRNTLPLEADPWELQQGGISLVS